MVCTTMQFSNPMEVKKLKNSIQVINLDTEPAAKRVNSLFPNTMRAAILGPSGCGKTNVLLTILMYKKPFYNIYLCSKTAQQNKYRLLDDLVGQHNADQKGRKKVSFHTIDNVEDLPPPERVKSEAIIIFDDVLTENQTRIAEYFMRGRHNKISCFYLAQSYTKIPKKAGIRENFNYFVIFKQDAVNLRQLYNEHVSHEITDFKKFKQVCQYCWKEKFGFIVLDLDDGRPSIKKNFEYEIGSV